MEASLGTCCMVWWLCDLRWASHPLHCSKLTCHSPLPCLHRHLPPLLLLPAASSLPPPAPFPRSSDAPTATKVEWALDLSGNNVTLPRSLEAYSPRPWFLLHQSCDVDYVYVAR